MTTVNEMSTQQINAALLSLRNEMQQMNVGNTSSENNNNSGSSVSISVTGSDNTNYVGEDPISVESNTISIDTTGTWEGTANEAIHSESANKDELGNVINNTYVNNDRIGQADGVASLDENGRIPFSQLPESAMEFKGKWDANTNTPTLVQGQGTNGDFYIVSVEGTFDNVYYNVGDKIIFIGEDTKWERIQSSQVYYSTPIGSITASIVDLSNEGWLPFNGNMNFENDYPELYSLLLRVKPEWCVYSSVYEQGLFVLPDFSNRFIEQTNIPEEIGTFISAGLPNITGEATFRPGQYYNTTYSTLLDATGSFSKTSGSSVSNLTKNDSSNSKSREVLNLDASRNGEDPIYGKSDTVQPAAIKFQYFIKAKNFKYIVSEEKCIDDTKTNFISGWSGGKINGLLNNIESLIPTHNYETLTGKTEGYFKFGNILIQYGYVSSSGNLDTKNYSRGVGGTVTLPISYANSNYTVIVSPHVWRGTVSGSTVTRCQYVGYNIIDNTQFYAQCYGGDGDNTACGYSWVAIGMSQD